MRRILYVLGALFLVIVVTGGVALVIAAYNGLALDRESKAYVDASIPVITKDWSEAELLKRVTPELRNNTTPEQLNSAFDDFRKLGSLVKYRGSNGEATMSYVTSVGKTISASYVAKATFRNGSATIKISLLKLDGRWLISNFHVDLDSTVPTNQQQTAT